MRSLGTPPDTRVPLMNDLTLLRALVIAVTLVPRHVAAAQHHVPSADAIERAVRIQVDSGFSGVVLVGFKDSVLLRRAYSPRAQQLRPSDSFWIASMTKGFTGA